MLLSPNEITVVEKNVIQTMERGTPTSYSHIVKIGSMLCGYGLIRDARRTPSTSASLLQELKNVTTIMLNKWVTNGAICSRVDGDTYWALTELGKENIHGKRP